MLRSGALKLEVWRTRVTDAPTVPVLAMPVTIERDMQVENGVVRAISTRSHVALQVLGGLPTADLHAAVERPVAAFQVAWDENPPMADSDVLLPPLRSS